MRPPPKPDALFRLAVAAGLTFLVTATSLLLTAVEWLASGHGMSLINRTGIPMSLVNRTGIPELVLYGTMPLLLCAILAAIVGLTTFLTVDYIRDRRRRP